MRSLLAVAIALVAAVPAAATTAPARVWLSSEAPVVVRGAGFHARTAVAVKVVRGEVTLRKSVVSGARGGFVMRWARSLPVGCSPTTVVARDARGRSDSYIEVVNDCPPPPPKQ